MTNKSKEIIKGLILLIIGIIILLYNINQYYAGQAVLVIFGIVITILGMIKISSNSIEYIKLGRSCGSKKERSIGWVLVWTGVLFFCTAGYMYNLNTAINILGISFITIAISKFLPS